MQMSRSVIIPMTRMTAATTGTAPQSASHMIRAAVCRLSFALHDCTALVIKSETFMVWTPWNSIATQPVSQDRTDAGERRFPRAIAGPRTAARAPRRKRCRSVARHHGYKPHGTEVLARDEATVLAIAKQSLRPGAWASGYDENAVVCELIEQRLGNLVRCCGHENPVEGRLLGPARVAVARAHVNVRVAEPKEACAR